MSSVSRETGGAEPASGEESVSRETGFPGSALTWFVLLPIHLYRKLISPLSGPRCRYYPTCSSYAERAIRELGPLRGSIVAAWRVLRCNPFSSGGLDPLENRRLFRSDNPRRPGGDRNHQPTS